MISLLPSSAVSRSNNFTVWYVIYNVQFLDKMQYLDLPLTQFGTDAPNPPVPALSKNNVSLT